MRVSASRRSARRWFITFLAPLLLVSGIVGLWSSPAMAFNALACDPHGPQPIDGSLAGALNPQLNATMKNRLNNYNMSCARVVTATILGRGMPARAAEIAVTTIIVETAMANLDGGDGSSVGLFQQISSWGSFAQRTDPVWATNAFINSMLSLVPGWQTEPIGQVCQKVQRSGFPDRYNVQVHDGVIIADALYNQLGKSTSQVAIAGLDNALYHEMRFASGGWTGFAPLNGVAKGVDIAVMPDGTSQVAVVGADDAVYHEGRHRDSSWTGFVLVPGAPKAKSVAIAALPDDTSQVVVVGRDDSVVYHALRHADGSWTGFSPVPNAMKAKSADIAGLPDGTAQLLIIGASDDVVYHGGRHADGSWTPSFQAIAGPGSAVQAKAKDVSIAGLPDRTSQILIVGLNDDVVYHEGRFANGVWTGLQPLSGMGTSAPAKARDVSIAGLPDSTSQVLITGLSDDIVYHQLRSPADGKWTGFQPLPGMGTTASAKANDVAIA
jgi:hypothetical protein